MPKQYSNSKSGVRYRTLRPSRLISSGRAKTSLIVFPRRYWLRMRFGERVKLLIVIVNYRVAPLVVDCLRSIVEELDRVPGTCVAVCENGSGDNSAETIKKAIDENSWQSWC